MLRMLRCELVLLVSVLVFCGVLSCSTGEGDFRSRWLVSPELLEHAKLEVVWENELPIRKTEDLERLVILDERIYALSDRNYMVSLNKEKGNIIFSKPIVPAGFAILGLELYRNELISIVGNELVEISRETGTRLQGERLGFGVTCPAARNSSYFYLGRVDGRLRTLRAKDKVKLFEVATENDSMITSIIADERFVIFATDGGNVISIRADRPKRLWQFDADEGVVGPIVRDGRSLFFASEDTNVYKLNIRTGQLAWKYQAEAVLDTAPRVAREAVYQYVRNEGLTAIDRDSGRFMWRLREGVDLLAEADGKAYVITNAGTLAVMDNRRAKELYSVNFAGVSKYAVNVSDSKIYIADESGRIACLKPTE